MFACPAPGCGRRGDFGFRRKDKLKEHMRNDHHMNVSREERAVGLSRETRASPAEEDTPRKRTKCFRAVMAPAIWEVGPNQSEVRRGTNLKLTRRPPHEVARGSAR